MDFILISQEILGSAFTVLSSITKEELIIICLTLLVGGILYDIYFLKNEYFLMELQKTKFKRKYLKSNRKMKKLKKKNNDLRKVLCSTTNNLHISTSQFDQLQASYLEIKETKEKDNDSLNKVINQFYKVITVGINNYVYASTTNFIYKIEKSICGKIDPLTIGETFMIKDLEKNECKELDIPYICKEEKEEETKDEETKDEKEITTIEQFIKSITPKMNNFIEKYGKFSSTYCKGFTYDQDNISSTNSGNDLRLITQYNPLYLEDKTKEFDYKYISPQYVKEPHNYYKLVFKNGTLTNSFILGCNAIHSNDFYHFKVNTLEEADSLQYYLDRKLPRILYSNKVDIPLIPLYNDLFYIVFQLNEQECQFVLDY
jgi:hypothetical protein